MSPASNQFYKSVVLPTITRITGAFLRRQKVLIIGAQNGRIAHDVLKSGTGPVVGIEMDSVLVEEAKKTYANCAGLTFKNHSIFDEPIAEEYVGVVGIYTFNQVEPEKLNGTFQCILSLLKEEGFILGVIRVRDGRNVYLYTKDCIEKKLYQVGFQKVVWFEPTVVRGECENYSEGNNAPKDMFFVAFKNKFE